MTKCFVDNCRMSGNHDIKKYGPEEFPITLKLCDKHKDLYFEGKLDESRINIPSVVLKNVRA